MSRRHLPPLLVAALASVIYLAWSPPSNDLAVQDFRIELFRRAPFAIWDNQWFAGHHTPAYSLLSPLLGAAVGPRWLGVLSLVAATWACSVLVHRLAHLHHGLTNPTLAAVLFAVGGTASLYGGRISFLLGVAFGVTTLVLALDRRIGTVAGMAALTAVASPVAGVFVAVIGCATFMARSIPRPSSVALVVASVAPVGLLGALFPEGGYFPFPIGGLVNVLLVCAGLWWFGREYPFVRWVCIGYAAFSLLSALPFTPVGGNAARLAAVAAAPLLVMVADVSFRRVSALLVPLLVLQWAPISLTFTEVSEQDDPAFYEPLLEVVRAQAGPQRIEVVPVSTHGEADVVALEVPIARGWNRQLDRKYNELFYEDPEETSLDPAEYLAWLQENGVSMVAVADTELDEGGLLEQRLLEDPPDYLQLVHRDAVWAVYRVQPDPSLVTGDGAVTDIAIDSFSVTAFSPGDLVVKVRFSPWFTVTSGRACVTRTEDGWTRVTARSRGIVRVDAVLSLRAVLDRDGDC